MSLAVVIPTINSGRYLKELVASFPLEGEWIILIDNGSTDGTAEYIAELVGGDTEITKIHLPKNIGVAPAWNMGIRLALDGGMDAVAVLNHDIVLAPDTLRTLVRWTHDGVAVPTVCAVDDLVTARRQRWVTRPGDFCGFLVTAPVIDAVGWFDEGFRIAYLEDLDFELRLLEAGITHGSCHDALVKHYGSIAIREGGVRHWEAFQQNAVYFEKKWGRDYETARREIAGAGPVQIEKC